MRLSCNFVKVYTIVYRVQYTFTREHARASPTNVLARKSACVRPVGEDRRACPARGKLNVEVAGGRTRRHPRYDPRAEVGDDVGVGVGVHVGPMEFQLYSAARWLRQVGGSSAVARGPPRRHRVRRARVQVPRRERRLRRPGQRRAGAPRVRDAQAARAPVRDGRRARASAAVRSPSVPSRRRASTPPSPRRRRADVRRDGLPRRGRHGAGVVRRFVADGARGRALPRRTRGCGAVRRQTPAGLGGRTTRPGHGAVRPVAAACRRPVRAHSARHRPRS